MQDKIRGLLETTCTRCHGAGWVTGSEFKNGDIKPASPKDPGSRRCGCVAGKVPTELGEAILEFVKDHLEEWAEEKGHNHTHTIS